MQIYFGNNIGIIHRMYKNSPENKPDINQSSEINENTPESFFKSDLNNTQLSQIHQQLSKKVQKLPLLMDSICSRIDKYITGEIPTARFAQLQCEYIPQLFQRINLGQDSLAYKESYKNEIALIKEISITCNQYNAQAIKDSSTQQALDTSILNAVKTYLNNPDENRTQFFK